VILVDTHAHLDAERFAGDREEVIARAEAAGVHAIVTVGTDQASSVSAMALAEQHPGLYAAVGVHPHEAAKVSASYLDDLAQWGLSCKVVAIGEIGLDFHYNFSPPEVQRRIFTAQLKVAQRVGKPVIIHDREAHAETLALLREHGRGLRGVLHCFSGSLEMAREAIQMGFFISFAGPVTFENAHRLQQVVRDVPLQHMLVETDCPYLAPHPYRGKRNEPAHTVLVANKIAGLLGISLDRIAEATTANARMLFGLPDRADGHAR
jgi:TatD DNase family protein